MALKLVNKKALNQYILGYSRIIEQALVFQLEYLVAELTNHAKTNAGYKDRTSNLKGSIGGTVLKDGNPITYRGFDGFGQEGNEKGFQFINSLIGDYQNGYVLLVVAGMDYATYVENNHNLNVLKKSELKMRREIQVILNRLKRKL